MRAPAETMTTVVFPLGTKAITRSRLDHSATAELVTYDRLIQVVFRCAIVVTRTISSVTTTMMCHGQPHCSDWRSVALAQNSENGFLSQPNMNLLNMRSSYCCIARSLRIASLVWSFITV